MTAARAEGPPPEAEEAEDDSAKTKRTKQTKEGDKGDMPSLARFKSVVNFFSSRKFSSSTLDSDSPADSPTARRRMTPRKSALKAFDKDALAVNQMSDLSLASEREFSNSEHAQSKEGRVNFLVEYGLSKVMRKRVLSKSSRIYCMTVLLDNGPSMKNDDAKVIVGQKKGGSEGLPEDKRLAENVDYDRSVETGQRLAGAKDTSYFLIKFAATMALPLTLELFKPGRNSGRMSCFRRIGTTAHARKKGSAEDYLPLCEQVESANELIDDCPWRLAPMGGNPLNLIKRVKEMCEEESAEIGKHGGDVMVTIYTSQYPWGNRGGDSDIPGFTDNFVELMNEFVDLPVTFLFIVDTQEQKIIDFYNNIVKAETEVRAKVQVAKGLGCMIDGIKKYNPWLNYSLPMHICQILGICSNILSRAASRPLDKSEVRELCNTLIGDVPDPAEDIEAFVDRIKGYMKNNDCSKWSPVSGEESPLIDTIHLKKHLSKNSIGLAGLVVATLVCIIAIIVRMSSKEFASLCGNCY